MATPTTLVPEGRFTMDIQYNNVHNNVALLVKKKDFLFFDLCCRHFYSINTFPIRQARNAIDTFQSMS